MPVDDFGLNPAQRALQISVDSLAGAFAGDQLSRHYPATLDCSQPQGSRRM
jgi:hypothetical protein